MAKVISGTRQAKVGIIKTSHKAGFNKIRCSACGIGMAVEVLNNEGKKVLRCDRCGREYRVSSLL
jgi:ribosomal protein L37E